ncbi:MAG TPA: hypothetical protein QGF75_00160 [Candidatus Marinimicrobia bacterium]|nr:hypothetical protein [Candidatus Neomarinimicrobiota bacterium]|tara:strand:- start:5457 stop:5690 length:234 start_codon:yes stop_codon:yes gene_type:complete
MDLNAKAAALSFGIFWGAMTMIFAWCGITEIVTFLQPYYLGIDTSFIGGLIGGFWGFFDGAICGFLVTWLYNKLNNN